jgi:hypothetical protein
MTRKYFNKDATRHALLAASLLAAGFMAGAVQAALPAPTPAAQQAAAAKKADADAQAAKDKQSLGASMDAVSAHWRSQAAQKGWKTHPAVAIAAAPAPAPAAGAAPASGTASGPGSSAPITGAVPAGQPAGTLTATSATLPIRSEKLGTAPPSTDVKAGPTQPQPRNAPPTVQKGTPDVKNR